MARAIGGMGVLDGSKKIQGSIGRCGGNSNT